MLNQLDTIRIFCVAAESASFKDAAIRLGTSPQTVTRAVQELEKTLGEVLFHRNTRRIGITEFGAALALRARASLADIDNLFQRPGQGGDEELSGSVRITSTTTLGRLVLMPALYRLARDYPDIKLDLRLSDAIADVIDEKIDIGVRVGFFSDNRYVARMPARIRFTVVGTPELVARAGVPDTLAELSRMPVIGLVDRNMGRVWPWPFADGQQLVLANPAFCTDDSDAECAAVLAGLGYGQLPEGLARPHVRSGALVPVLEHLAPEPWGIYVYRPQRGPVAARIRLVYDALVAAIEQSELFDR